VVGIDCFTPSYDVAAKVDNIRAMRRNPQFKFAQSDLRSEPLDALLGGVDIVFHQAALAGVRASWDHRFADYATHNVLATQRLLEASRDAGVKRFVYASSSSVYGNALSYPTLESAVPAPFSPYGVTKLAGEHLCMAYAHNFGLHTVALRYFTVFGPRQRPDMGIHRLIHAAMVSQPFELYGDGHQRREFTYVSDVVDANVLASTADVEPGLVCNIAGGGDIDLSGLIDLVGELVHQPVPIERAPAMAGDVRRNRGSTELARESLGWAPKISLREGVGRQVEWQRSLSTP
jgi:UDP-glucuronate 4-epimerase